MTQNFLGIMQNMIIINQWCNIIIIIRQQIFASEYNILDYTIQNISWQDYKVTFTFKVSLSINFTFYKELLCFSLYETASDTWKEEMAIDQQNTELVPNNILN